MAHDFLLTLEGRNELMNYAVGTTWAAGLSTRKVNAEAAGEWGVSDGAVGAEIGEITGTGYARNTITLPGAKFVNGAISFTTSWIAAADWQAPKSAFLLEDATVGPLLYAQNLWVTGSSKGSGAAQAISAQTLIVATFSFEAKNTWE